MDQEHTLQSECSAGFCNYIALQQNHFCTESLDIKTLLYWHDAESPRGGKGKLEWTKNKLEELRRRSPGHNSPAHHAAPGPNANMGQQTTKRRLIAFIGGLDMCDGRYDTPRHSLFHTLATVHTEDFHQACISGADIKKGGGPF